MLVAARSTPEPDIRTTTRTLRLAARWAGPALFPALLSLTACSGTTPPPAVPSHGVVASPTAAWLESLDPSPWTSERALAWLDRNEAVLLPVNHGPIGVLADLSSLTYAGDGLVHATYRVNECLKGEVPEGLLELTFRVPDPAAGDDPRLVPGAVLRDMWELGAPYVVYAHYRVVDGRIRLVMTALPLPDVPDVRRHCYGMLTWTRMEDEPF